VVKLKCRQFGLFSFFSFFAGTRLPRIRNCDELPLLVAS
jgi:hypothetical protein